MNIHQKLIEVRKAVPYLKKDNKGHQFQYVSSSQTLGNVREKMDELGLLLVPSVLDKRVSDHQTKNGNHEYFTEVDIKYTWVNSDSPEETVDCMWYGQGLDSGEKGVGKALTYAEKYFLLKFFNIATDKDDPDSFQGKVGRTRPQPSQFEKYQKMADQCVTVEKLGECYEQHREAIAKLQPADNKRVNSYFKQIRDALSVAESNSRKGDTSD